MRPKLSYANVVATLALFIAIGGAGAFAATQLAKNSVGTKQLKKNAVTTAKIKDGAVTGSKVDLASLGTVPNATHANRADSAGTADNADTAKSAAALAPPEAVHYLGGPGEPALGPSFKAAPNTLGFYKDRQCVVHLLGEVTGPSGSAAFILPEADVPQKSALEAVAVSLGLGGNVEVVTDGEVRPYGQGGGEHNFGLDGVTFRAANC